MNLRLAAILGSAVVLLAGVGAVYTRQQRASRASAVAAAAVSAAIARGDPVLHVPFAPGAIILDGDTDDPGWTKPPGAAKTGLFVLADGDDARPNSAARLVWGDGYLYLALYAADEDIESHVDQPDGRLIDEDAFHVVFAQPGVEYAIDISPRAVITDSVRRAGGAWDLSWSSGAHASKETDGTINNPNNFDEEWGIELAVPFEAIGMRGVRGETVELSLSRCDTPKDTPRVCAGWGVGQAGHPRGRLVLD